MKIALILLVCLIPAVASAQAVNDYEVTNDDWTGLSEFVALAERQGYRVNAVSEIDFGTLKPDQPLVVVYPRQPLKTRDLARYVIDGGRVLLADDFGRSEPFLQRLEIERFVPAKENLPHNRFLDDNAATPLFKPTGRHPLLTRVKKLVANHPSVIVNEGGPVVAYEDGSGLVYDMNLGDGKVIVVADASMFINQMLNVADNARFATNAVNYICDDRRDCEITVLVKTFAQTGRYAGDEDDLGSDLDEVFEKLNEKLESLGDELNSEFLFLLSLFLLVGLGVYLVTILPFIETRKYSGYISDFIDSIPQPQSEFDWNMSRFAMASKGTNDALPMAILKQIFEEIFLDEFGLWPSKSETRPNIEALVSMFSDKFLVGLNADTRLIERDLADLLAVLAKTPSRHRVFLENEADLRRGDLMKYHRIAIEILTIMGKEDDYERRTWGSP